MKMKASLIFIAVLLLAACGPKPAATPAATAAPASTEAATATPSMEADPVPTLEATITMEPDPSPDPAATVENSASTATFSDEAEVEIEDLAFVPAMLTVKAGTTVKFSNKDDVQHSVKADDGSWGSGALNKGDDFFFTFTQPGTYTYYCDPHLSMKGTIVVVS